MSEDRVTTKSALRAEYAATGVEELGNGNPAPSDPNERIVIRQLPSGRLTAWHAGRLLPLSVKIENHGGIGYVTLSGNNLAVALGCAITEEEVAAVNLAAPEWYRPV